MIRALEQILGCECMWVAVGLQTLAVLIGMVCAGLIGGFQSLLWLGAGGAAAVVPNVLFAWRLSRQKNKPPESYIVAFFLGEFLKVGLVIACLGLIVKYLPNASWLEVILGLILGLKAQLLGLWFTGDRSDRVIREAEEAKKLQLAAEQAMQNQTASATED
jgi:ATP synthase protein I